MDGERRPATLGEALDEFYGDLVLRDLSPGTVRTYRYQLAPRLDPALPLVSLDRAFCRSLMSDSLRMRSANTSRTLHGILCAFATWAVQRGYLAASPMSGIPMPQVRDRGSSALSARQLAAIAEACDDDRDRLILAMLCGTGLRRAELAGARWQDVDWERRRLTVIGKGRKRRLVHLPADAVPMLEARRQFSGPIIGVSGDRIYWLVRAIGKRAGLPWLHPHNFRHTWATDWLLRGGSAFHLQTLGGWASMVLIRKVYGQAAIEQAALDEARRLEGQP